MLRPVKIALVLAVGVWAGLSAFGNLIDWDGTRGAVASVSSMSSFEGGADDWRATTNPFIINGAGIAIATFKALTCVLCAYGGWQMWSVRTGEEAEFDRAKRYALAGCGVSVFGLFFGWITIGEQWFELWRSPQLELASEAAFRYAGFIALIAIFVAQRER